MLGGLAASCLLAIAGCQDPGAPGAPGGDEPLDPAASGTAQTTSAVTKSGVVPGEFIVVFRDEITAASRTSAVQAMRNAGATITRTYQIIPGVAGRFGAAQIAKLQTDPSVAYIEPNQYVSVGTVYPNPPFGLDRIDQPTGTNHQYDDFGFTGASVHIFVIDTGIRTTHHEFTGRVGVGFSAIDNNPSVEDCNGHGTHVASTAAGTRFGVAKGAIVHPVRVLDCNGNGTVADVIQGMDWVRTNGTTFPAVANMSLGGGLSTAINDAVAALTNANIPVVVAAGNSTADACQSSPSSAPSAITVGATDTNDVRAGFSNFGACVDLFAPGVNVQGAGIVNDDATAFLSGTSQATPHVAGAAALFLQRFPRVVAEKVRNGIVSNATPSVVGDPRGAPNLLLFTQFVVPPAASCFGRCGGQSPDFSCGCDRFCTVFDDCCVDFGALCSL